MSVIKVVKKEKQTPPKTNLFLDCDGDLVILGNESDDPADAAYARIYTDGFADCYALNEGKTWGPYTPVRIKSIEVEEV